MMKKFFSLQIFIFFALLSLSFFGPNKKTYSQQNCIQVKEVTTDKETIEAKKLFRCYVEVDRKSRTIACGVSINGGWPQNFCLSDEFFGGWINKTAIFNCVVPDETFLNRQNNLELVGFDFSPFCGPQTGKRISLKRKTDNDTAGQSPQGPSSPLGTNDDLKNIKNSIEMVRELLRILFFMSGNINLSSDYPGAPKPTLSSSTPNSSTVGLDYFIPFRDSDIKPSSLATQQILQSWPNSQIQYYDLIVSESIRNQWNPAFVLTLWVEETGASTRTKKENGGSGIPTSSGALARGHLGCAPHQDQTINESLNCLFKNFSQFSNNQFADFMARYSGGPPENPFANNPNFPKNIRYWYSKISSVDLVLLPTPTSYFPLPPKADHQYFAQCDPRWGNIPLPDGPEKSTICKAGCGPTTTAMIVSSLTNNHIDPPSMVNFYKENGKYIGSDGSNWSDNVSILKSLGLKTTREFSYNFQPAEVIIKDIDSYIKNGWTFFTLANFCPKGCGHFFWIVDVGSVWAHDPYYGNGKSIPFDETAGPFPKEKHPPLFRRLIGVK